ncbi:hypothetical protein AAC387_Pa03g4389 [Persea americana]
MADFSTRAFAISLMAVMISFSLIGGSFAADAPAPAPASGAVGVSPPLAAVFFVSFAALFGSLMY